MKNQILALLAITGVIASFAWNFLNKAPKMGYVESSVLMDEFSESIKAKKAFEELQKGWDKNLKILNDSLMASMNIMKAEYEKSGEGRKMELRAAFEKKQDDYQRYAEAVKKMSAEKERELMDPVIKKVNSFLDIWGKQKRFGLIFGTTAGGNIIQADPALNLTSEILKDLNEHYMDTPVGSDSVPKASDSSRQGK